MLVLHSLARPAQMKIPADKKFWLLPVVLSIAILATAHRVRENPRQANALSTLPPVMLWAWERPENLSFIDPTQTGVAFLAKTISLRNEGVLSRPRMQRLHVPNGTKLVAVARIEVDRTQQGLSEQQLQKTVDAISDLAKLSNVSMVQIDFDAVSSEREFYRRLIIEVRRQLPAALPLSMTALASWCDGDKWLSDLPLDEAVPMFFRMGLESRRFASRLEDGSNFLSPPCESSAGISTDEKIRWPKGRRVYIFNPTSWTRESFKTAMEAREE